MRTVLYELGGQSLEAARSLHILFYNLMQRKPISEFNTVADLHKAYQESYKNLLEWAADINPKILELAGLDKPCIQIEHEKRTYPRAYKEYPSIFLFSGSKTRYFMSCPVDYKGKHFIPEGAREIIGEEREAFSGGSSTFVDLIAVKKEGTEMPEDASRISEFTIASNPGTISDELQVWLNLDRNDRGWSIEPPPMPETLAKEYKNLNSQLSHNP